MEFLLSHIALDTSVGGENDYDITLQDNAGNESDRVTITILRDSPADFSGLSTFDGPFNSKGLQGTITDKNGIASVTIEYSDGDVSTHYSDGNINNESTHLAGTTYTITVVDDNGVKTVSEGTL